ncbi:MAG: homoserine dehydrogenase [Chitinophagales bacterium]|nr:MAG: homoserine dehydrogenase [Chitinophagales bacterium]
MKRNHIQLGIFGFGVVGQGLYRVLNQTRGIRATIKKIGIKHPEKERPIDSGFFTTRKDEILDDPDIHVIVELINDADAAYEIVTEAMKRGKGVVSASKKMIARHLPELFELQNFYRVPFLYEAAVCASIPIIRNLEEYYDNDLLKSVEGIINGSTNYILTRLHEGNKSYQDALREAQENGFAESDPSSDVEGYDAKYKLCIILLHAFGLFVREEDIFNYGITHINDFDIRFAKQRGWKIKLIAACRQEGEKVSAFILPKFITPGSRLTDIDEEYNGLIVESAFSENQVFIGKGAGGNPTGSAVLSDISALTYDYRYEYKKFHQLNGLSLTDEVPLEIYVRYNDPDIINGFRFSAIRERYESETFRYFIGTTTLRDLRRAPWLHEKDVSIILMH